MNNSKTAFDAKNPSGDDPRDIVRLTKEAFHVPLTLFDEAASKCYRVGEQPCTNRRPIPPYFRRWTLLLSCDVTKALKRKDDNEATACTLLPAICRSPGLAQTLLHHFQSQIRSSKTYEMKKELLLFGPIGPPYGGVSIYMDNLRANLKRLGFEPKNIDYQEQKSLLRNYIVLNHAISHGALCLDSYGYFVEYPSWRTALPWAMVKIIKRFHWVKIVHDGTLPSRYRLFKIRWKLIVLLAKSLVDTWITVNQELFDWISSYKWRYNNVILLQSMLPYGFDFESIRTSNQIELLRQRYQALICSVGAFSPNYGFHHIAEAVEKIRSKTSANIGLLLIDGGFAKDGTYEKSILQNRTWIVPIREIPNREVIGILKSCHIYIRGTEQESYGLSKIEALLCGTTVISTKVGETRGMRLYDFDDVDSLQICIENVLFANENTVPDEVVKMYQDIGLKNLECMVEIIKKHL